MRKRKKEPQTKPNREPRRFAVAAAATLPLSSYRQSLITHAIRPPRHRRHWSSRLMRARSREMA